MTDYGRKKIADAKKNGQWDAVNPLAVITEEQIAQLSAILESYEPAYTNFQAMSLSVKKIYTRAFFDAKTDAGRAKRIAWMVDSAFLPAHRKILFISFLVNLFHLAVNPSKAERFFQRFVIRINIVYKKIWDRETS